jgi:outer membrane biogenesis lipoprotein LolB
MKKLTIFIAFLLLSACGFETESYKACFDASRARAEALQRYISTPEQHPALIAARKDEVSAAIEWQKKECSNVKL